MELETEHRELIESLYREILGRQADASGLDTFGRMLRKNGIAATVPSMVKALLASAEYQHRPSAPAHGGSGSTPARQVNGRKIAHVISLGTHCMAGIYLRKYRYKRYSLPFDWLYSSPEAVLHCLNDDFKEFLDARHYVALPPPPPPHRPEADHTFYRDQFGVHRWFAHRDPTTGEDHQYYQRTVDRFRQIIAGTEAKLFVMIVRPLQSVAETFPALSAKLNAMTANSAFICVQVQPPTLIAGCSKMRRLQVEGEHALYEFKPSSESPNAQFTEPFDALSIVRLLNQYDMELASAARAGI